MIEKEYKRGRMGERNERKELGNEARDRSEKNNETKEKRN